MIGFHFDVESALRRLKPSALALNLLTNIQNPSLQRPRRHRASGFLLTPLSKAPGLKPPRAFPRFYPRDDSDKALAFLVKVRSFGGRKGTSGE